MQRIDRKPFHIGTRDYDPRVGKWLSKDPLLFGGGQTNLYGYAINDPINSIDPSGRIAIVDDLGVAVGAIIVTGGVIGVANGLATYSATGSASNAFRSFGSGFVSGSLSAGAAILTSGVSTIFAVGAAAGVDIGFSALTAPTSIPSNGSQSLIGGLNAITNPQPTQCPGR